ncbi:MAG TPA: glycine cleavage system protein GcvH [Actinomycetota bacterium]|nr:glycine cleavage system protein GcvH [Actinomycetota bacterium]
MTELPDDRRYTAEHEWARADGARVLVGITDYAQDQLGDVVFVALPEPGTEVEAGKPLGEVESTKSVSDIYSPVTGKVVERNAELEQTPELVNEDPYGEGWLVAIDGGDASLDELMSAEQYRALIEGGA